MCLSQSLMYGILTASWLTLSVLVRSQVTGSGASGGGLAVYQVATVTVSGDVYNANAADTGGGGIGATGYNSSSLLIQDTRHGAASGVFSLSRPRSTG